MNVVTIGIIAKLLKLPKFIHKPITVPVIKYWTWQLDREIADRKYWERIRSQARIAWGYDGALNCGRDQEDWLEEAFSNLGTFAQGKLPPVILIRTIINNEDTPWHLRAKIDAVLYVYTVYRNVVETAAWKKHLLSILIGVLGTLLILGA